ncbi:MAG: hypothetical protein N3E41_08575 [Thermofilaceae archaeon]|nr:hypothetical protein [Thermofilaceae archaeon]
MELPIGGPRTLQRLSILSQLHPVKHYVRAARPPATSFQFFPSCIMYTFSIR